MPRDHQSAQKKVSCMQNHITGQASVCEILQIHKIIIPFSGANFKFIILNKIFYLARESLSLALVTLASSCELYKPEEDI